MTADNGLGSAAGARKRDVNLDLIRCVALFCLPSLHGLAYLNFYEFSMSGWLMVLLGSFRTMSMMCLPLFLMLTGYLMSRKTFSLGYFKGIVRVWVIFFLCKSAIVVFYEILWAHHTVTPLSFIRSLTAGVDYNWYVGLYSWLYCLIPLMNILFHSCDTKPKKQAFLLAVIGLLILPSIGNYYKSDMPDLFHGMWPLAYYYIGAYVREYHNDGHKTRALLLFLGSALLSCTVSTLISRNTTYLRNALNDWNSAGTAAMATSLFVFLRKLDLRKISARGSTILAKISEWSFGAYLLTWIFDNVLYDQLAMQVPDNLARMKYYFVMVPLVLACSILSSAVINGIYTLLAAGASEIYQRRETLLSRATDLLNRRKP